MLTSYRIIFTYFLLHRRRLLHFPPFRLLFLIEVLVCHFFGWYAQCYTCLLFGNHVLHFVAPPSFCTTIDYFAGRMCALRFNFIYKSTHLLFQKFQSRSHNHKRVHFLLCSIVIMAARGFHYLIAYNITHPPLTLTIMHAFICTGTGTDTDTDTQCITPWRIIHNLMHM